MKKSLNLVGYIAALLMLTTVVMKGNHLPGAGIVMVLAGVAVSIYLPFFLLYKPGSPVAVGSDVVGLIGAASASVINLSITFKFQHWPGAGMLLTIGLASFALIFLPLLLLKKRKEEKGQGRRMIMNLLGMAGLALFALGLLFKIMHWPGASVMLLLSVPLLFFGYFLLYLSDPSVDAEAKTVYLRKAFLSVIIGSVVSTLILLALNKPYFAPSPETAGHPVVTAQR